MRSAIALLDGVLVTLDADANRAQVASALVRHLIEDTPYGDVPGRAVLDWLDAHEAVVSRVRSPAIEGRSRRLTRLADRVVEQKNRGR